MKTFEEWLEYLLKDARRNHEQMLSEVAPDRSLVSWWGGQSHAYAEAQLRYEIEQRKFKWRINSTVMSEYGTQCVILARYQDDEGINMYLVEHSIEELEQLEEAFDNSEESETQCFQVPKPWLLEESELLRNY
jgi:hypothetical protein